MKGKVKSIYENMKNILDPTPRFDSHISKNASKVTSLNSYRAFELTQQYFYEYTFDELRQRPRQVCPCAVISFHFKGKDSPLPSKPLAPIRLNSQSAEGSKERAQFTVWTGDLVKGDQVLFQISLRSYSPPLLPHRLPEKLKVDCLMRLDQVTKLVPAGLFSFNLYNSSQEVVKSGHYCSLLEVVDKSRSTTSITKLLQELEIKRVVLVTPLTERGFLFLLSSVQMATPAERGENWKRCLQALFVFPEHRDVAKSTSRCASSPRDASQPFTSGATVMPRLNQFIPALHHALVKARANPPPELSAGVERQAREYLIGLTDGKVRQYPMGEYDSKLDERGKLFPAPKHHRVNMDGYLRSYLYNPALYLLSVARARQMVEVHCGPEESQEAKVRKSFGGQKESTGKEVTGNTRDGQSNTQKMQQLIDLVLTCKRNAENEVKREEGGDAGLTAPGRKRRREQETAERALKFLKASQEHGSHDKIPVEGSQIPESPGSLASVIGSVGLRDIDLREDGSELAAKLISLLTGLNQAASGMASQSLCEAPEEEQRESCPFDKLATRLGLPTNCDIDLRKQEELEEQMAGSVSSLEGFSPSSHSGEMNHHGAAGRGGGGGGGGGGLGRRAGGYEEEEEEGEIPWVLIPITGLCSERYTQRDRNIPQDPRFQHLTTASSITTPTKSPRKSPTLSPEPSPPTSPFQCLSPEPSPPLSPSQCPSPDPSPPLSPSQCPSPEPSPPLSPSQCPSPVPSPPPSPSQCPSPQPSPPSTPLYCPSPQPSPPPSPSRCQSLEPNERNPLNKSNSGANEERLASTASREFAGMSKDRQEKPQGKEKKNEEPSIFASIQPSIPPAPERRTNSSPPPSEQGKEDAVLLEKETVQKMQKQREEEATERKQDEEEVVDMICEVADEKEQKGDANELVSSPPARPLRDIDRIVDKHLGDFSSEIQLLLQEESIHYSFPQSPHSTSNIETTAPEDTFPHPSISQFSQYVSFYNPCPPVQDYISSLQDSINSMLTEFSNSWPSHSADTRRTDDADATLANKVSAFVARIRAANSTTGRDDEVSAPCGELSAADVNASVSQTPVLSRAGEVWQPDAITRPFPDANPPTSHVTLSVPTSASGSVYKPTDTAVLRPPLNKSPQSHWKPQSHTLEANRTVDHNVRQTQDNSITKTVHCPTDVEGGTSLTGSNSDLTLPGFSSVSKPSAEPSHSSEPVSSSAIGVDPRSSSHGSELPDQPAAARGVQQSGGDHQGRQEELPAVLPPQHRARGPGL
uniref:TASOR pseudo-PARP domain-containing protein n=1 Tax=Lates calcarifer TaxID=8187 RepID=A0A4W6BJL2_LATCA